MSQNFRSDAEKKRITDNENEIDGDIDLEEEEDMDKDEVMKFAMITRRCLEQKENFLFRLLITPILILMQVMEMMMIWTMMEGMELIDFHRSQLFFVFLFFVNLFKQKSLKQKRISRSQSIGLLSFRSTFLSKGKILFSFLLLFP